MSNTCNPLQFPGIQVIPRIRRESFPDRCVHYLRDRASGVSRVDSGGIVPCLRWLDIKGDYDAAQAAAVITQAQAVTLARETFEAMATIVAEHLRTSR